MNLLTAPQVWADYDADKYDLEPKAEGGGLYTYTAQKTDTGDVRVQIEVKTPDYDSNKVLLLIGRYDAKVQKEVAVDLVKRGYTVCVPDYSGIAENTLTAFPAQLEYGYFEKAGDHIKKVSPTAKDTSQYLYAVIIRRAITFINEVLNKKEIILMAFGDGVEVAMQAAGEDKRTLGLVCINGASYLEYVNYPKYGSNKELPIDDEIMAWLTGVSSVAYAKRIEVPVLFALGSNGTQSDIDRMVNIFNLIPGGDIRLTISPRYADNIDRRAYDTVLMWLENKFVFSTLPEMPVVTLSVNKEGAVYADVKVDSVLKIDEVTVYYSYGDYNHTTRHWENEKGVAAAINEFIAKLEISEPDAPLFVFAEVKYRNNITLSSLPVYQALGSYKVKSAANNFNPIIYQYSDDDGEFIEAGAGDVLLNGSLKEAVIPVGLKGIMCQNSAMVNFAIGTKKNMSGKLLQIDVFGPEEYELSVTLMTGGDAPRTYTAVKETESGDMFTSVRYVPNDFKDKDFRALENWSAVKAVRIDNPGIVVGKVMYV